jgi:hypothetical protein
MNKEQAVKYLRFSGFSDEQIKAIEGAFSGWGKVCPSAGIDCEDCPAYEDAIGRKAVLNTLENMDRALDEDRTVESYKDLLRECYKVLPSVTPKPKSECEHDHEILKAYSDGASAVLDKIRAEIEQYEHYLELLDADMKDGSATIVTKTKYAVYTEVVKQLKEVLESEGKA